MSQKLKKNARAERKSRAAEISAGIWENASNRFWFTAIFALAFTFRLIDKTILDLLLLSSLIFRIIFFLKEGEHHTKWPAIGVLLGLLGLSRENALILVLVVPFWIVISASEQSLLVRMCRVRLFFAGLMLVLMPVSLQNLAVGGEFKLTTVAVRDQFFYR